MEDRYVVVINDDEQYSVWPAGRVIPNGWSALDVRASKDECLDYIEKVWTDMRPRSVRALLEGGGR